MERLFGFFQPKKMKFYYFIHSEISEEKDESDHISAV